MFLGLHSWPEAQVTHALLQCIYCSTLFAACNPSAETWMALLRFFFKRQYFRKQPMGQEKTPCSSKWLRPWERFSLKEAWSLGSSLCSCPDCSVQPYQHPVHHSSGQHWLWTLDCNRLLWAPIHLPKDCQNNVLGQFLPMSSPEHLASPRTVWLCKHKGVPFSSWFCFPNAFCSGALFLLDNHTFKNKSFREAILTFQNLRHRAFCTAKKMKWCGMIIKWLQSKKFFWASSWKKRFLFPFSILLLLAVKDQ